MQPTRLTHTLLALIATALAAIALHLYLQPKGVEAQTEHRHLYIEPGTQMLKIPSGQLFGRVVIDLDNGKIWGFPTGTTDAYPWDPLNNKPNVSHPVPLGRFAFEDLDK